MQHFQRIYKACMFGAVIRQHKFFLQMFLIWNFMTNVFHSNVLIGKTVSKHSPLKCFGNTSLFANVPGSFCAAAASKSHQIHPFLIWNDLKTDCLDTNACDSNALILKCFSLKCFEFQNIWHSNVLEDNLTCKCSGKLLLCRSIKVTSNTSLPNFAS